ncbi:MAG: flagellar hook-basal body complex protein FliE [Bdellovibrionales bacterium]|nr:flagellar hook-basal body complex protein FliE [Bdellovibrionales bacterium]
MDGLTVTTAKDLLTTGKTFSEMSNKRIHPESGDSSVKSFKDTLSEAVGKVNEMQKDADIKMQKLAAGESSNISEVMVAAEKADIALKLMMSVRNKVIDAYQEIMKMQV